MQTGSTTQTSATLPATPPTAPAKKSEISTDFDTFLKMLTTQLENQDPLNPVDSADYAVQLATFSGVEQQTRTNQLLEALTGQFGVSGLSQLAGWVGKEARSSAPVLFDGAPVSVTYAPNIQADRTVLVVKNAAGEVVSRETVPVSAAPYQWLGANAAGDPLPDGVYALSLESYKGTDLLDTVGVESYARIIEARNGPGGATLVVAGGVEITADRITALRSPPLP